MAFFLGTKQYPVPREQNNPSPRIYAPYREMVERGTRSTPHQMKSTAEPVKKISRELGQEFLHSLDASRGPQQNSFLQCWRNLSKKVPACFGQDTFLENVLDSLESTTGTVKFLRVLSS